MINRLLRIYLQLRFFGRLLFWICIAAGCIAELIILIWVLRV